MCRLATIGAARAHTRRLTPSHPIRSAPNPSQVSPEQRKALISDGFTPDADGAQRASKGRLSMSRVLGGVSSLARGSSALMKRAKATPM